jgi:hypothetical protein
VVALKAHGQLLFVAFAPKQANATLAYNSLVCLRQQFDDIVNLGQQ